MNEISRRQFILAGTGLLLTLTGCGASTPNGSAGAEDTSSTQTISITIGDTNVVKIDVPNTWELESDDDGTNTVTPDTFDGMISIGANVSPMTTFTSDDEVLDYWSDRCKEVSGEWTLVSKKGNAAPIYEAPVKFSSGKKAQGYMRVAISGEDSIMVEAVCAHSDWEAAKREIKQAIATYRLEDPQAPEYSEPIPKDQFTIVNATRGKNLGSSFWALDVTVRNNTDEAKQFLGFQIDELDADGNILSSYMSYNKNASYAVVEPGQSYTIELTEANDDGIAGMQSRYAEWGDRPSSATRSEYSEPFKQMF